MGVVPRLDYMGDFLGFKERPDLVLLEAGFCLLTGRTDADYPEKG